jgi:hypothetical protein
MSIAAGWRLQGGMAKDKRDKVQFSGGGLWAC